MKSDWFEEIILRSNSNMLRLERINTGFGKKYSQNKNHQIYNPILNKYISSIEPFRLKRSNSLSNKSKINDCGFINTNLNCDTKINLNSNPNFLDKFLGINFNNLVDLEGTQKRNQIKRNTTTLFVPNHNQSKSNPEKLQNSSKMLKKRNERIIFHELTDFPPLQNQNQIDSNCLPSKFISNSNLSSYLIKFLNERRLFQTNSCMKDWPKVKITKFKAKRCGSISKQNSNILCEKKIIHKKYLGKLNLKRNQFNYQPSQKLFQPNNEFWKLNSQDKNKIIQKNSINSKNFFKISSKKSREMVSNQQKIKESNKEVCDISPW